MVFSSKDLEGPLQKRGATGESGSDRREQEGVTLFQLPFTDGCHHREWNGARRGISVAIDVDDDLIKWHLQALSGRHDDSAIRLVRDEAIDISASLAILSEDTLGHLRHLLDGVFEYLLSVLMDDVHILLDGLGRGRIQRTATRHVEVFAAHAFDLMNVIEDAEIFAFFCGLEQNGSGAITEDDAGVAILVIDHRRVDVGTDDKNFLVNTAFDELGTCGQRIDETAASCGNVEAPAVRDIEFVLYKAGRGRIHHVGRNGADYDGFNVADVRTVALDKVFDGIHGQVAGSRALFDDMAFADASPRKDPVVGRLNHLLQLEIVEYFGRDISAESGDLGTSKRFQLRRSPVLGIEHCLPHSAVL